MALTKLTQNLIDGTIVTSVNGSSGAVTLETGTDWQTAIQTSNFTAVASKGYFVNTTSGDITINLPVGVVGTEIVIQDYAGTFATNKVILSANGSEKIQGVTDDFKCATNNATVTLVYQDATKGWTADNIETNAVLTVHYLVIGGGGGGGNGSGGAGGGAGGYRTNFGGTALTLNAATNYAITVGGGGAGLAPNTPSSNHGINGSSSVFHNITASAGGGGGSENDKTGNSGGSGGGGNYNASGGSGNAGNYTPVEGYAGGTGGTPANYSGGGGGGASAVGGNATGNGAGYGGDGLPNSITGSSVTYAGGGGGGSQSGGPGTPGPGGSGGGGNGASYQGTAGTNATPNTGGGGGGGAYSVGGVTLSSYAGGSGVVILRYPSGYAISGLSGSTDTTTIPGTSITTFTNVGTGNIQFN